MKKQLTLRIGSRVSLLLNQKALLTSGCLLLLTLLLFLLSTGMGDMSISPVRVLQAIFGRGDDMERLVVTSIRLPRVLMALLAGIGLAIAGSILQGLVRNPLASPEIIGVTGGAGAAVVLFLALFSDRDTGSLLISIEWLPLGAFLGATLTTFIVYLLSYKHGEVVPLRMVLIGIGIAALMQAVTTFFMILSPIHNASQANIWLIGTVNGTNWGDVAVLAPWITVISLVTWGAARKLNVQQLGDSLATGLGSHVGRQRLYLLLLCTALVGGAVAFAGGIGFVGLIAPHIARKLVGSSYGALIPAAALIGALLVMGADLMGRTLFSPLEVPTGVFTAAIGAPYFIYLLFKSRST
ncbi:iron ABC transporter permease [Paenibacillus sp. P96]|uniref:Iron ABC transporter permease n=1 Tax=Paenibacillus zeirhizosphaerae TaxID=2987519 RepID=A0ABT9FUM1_9BACL|nr:iron ABC transporter permease [Paenibacillus sp. P96]MDP4098395.1 iron ABC transporter permease [Paenibacillus sp. P96]